MRSAWSLLAILAIAAPAFADGEDAPPEPPPLKLKVALIEDPDFPSLDDGLVAEALSSAADTFAERFDVARPNFAVIARFSLDGFMRRYGQPDRPECARIYASVYKGGGREELLKTKDATIKFFQRWPLETLLSFVDEPRRPKVTDYAALWEEYAERYPATVKQLEAMKTPAGTPLVKLGGTQWRSHAAWSCASATQQDFDVLVTNTFLLADVLSEPHPHAVFGKAKVGGFAGPHPTRKALGHQVLVASTFGIDTNLPTLSELGGRPAETEERGQMLGAYLLAHEIAHAIFGIPDVFDHPDGCLMTSRPGETYREGLAALHQHPGPCPRCRPYVEARALLDRGRLLIDTGELEPAVRALTMSANKTPKQLHGGYKKRMSELSTMIAEAWAKLGDSAKAKRYADTAVQLDPTSDAQKIVANIKSGIAPTDKPELVNLKRTITASASAHH
ncbi:MAG: hypothetical protein U1E65_19950 [Myxococcota bacterium]